MAGIAQSLFSVDPLNTDDKPDYNFNKKNAKNYGVVEGKSVRLPQAFLFDHKGDLLENGKHDVIFAEVKKLLNIQNN